MDWLVHGSPWATTMNTLPILYIFYVLSHIEERVTVRQYTDIFLGTSYVAKHDIAIGTWDKDEGRASLSKEVWEFKLNA